MPGRKVTTVYNLFITRKSTSFKGTRAVCKFCFTEVSENGSRKEHIQKCQKCTDDIKSAYLKNKMVKLNPKTKRKKKLAATQQKSTGNSYESNCEVRNVTGIITLSDSEQLEKTKSVWSQHQLLELLRFFKCVALQAMPRRKSVIVLNQPYCQTSLQKSCSH